MLCKQCHVLDSNKLKTFQQFCKDWCLRLPAEAFKSLPIPTSEEYVNFCHWNSIYTLVSLEFLLFNPLIHVQVTIVA